MDFTSHSVSSEDLLTLIAFSSFKMCLLEINFMYQILYNFSFFQESYIIYVLKTGEIGKNIIVHKSEYTF